MRTRLAVIGIASFVLASFLSGTAFAVTSIPRVAELESAVDPVQYVQEQGIMTGQGYGWFAEDQIVNRAEFAKTILLLAARTFPPVYSVNLPFRDVPQHAWYKPSVVYAYATGLMRGYPDGTFRPTGSVNLAEVAKVMTIIYQLATAQDTGGPWYEEPIRSLAGMRAIPITIDSVFSPVTRGQLADIITRLERGDRTRSSLSYDELVSVIGVRASLAICPQGSHPVDVSISPNLRAMQAGDFVTYTVTLRNCSGRTAFVDLYASRDTQSSFESASGYWKQHGPHEIVWSDLAIEDGRVRTETVTVMVGDRAMGKRIDIMAYATTDRGVEIDTDTSSMVVEGGVSATPLDPCAGRPCRIPAPNCSFDAYGNQVCNNPLTCFYDDRGQYICRQTPDVSQDRDPCVDHPSRCGVGRGGLSVSLTADNDRPVRGREFETTIVIENGQDRDELVNVTANIDGQLWFEAASYSPDSIKGHRIEWDQLLVRARERLTILLTTEVDDRALPGQALHISTNVDGARTSADGTVYVRVGE